MESNDYCQFFYVIVIFIVITKIMINSWNHTYCCTINNYQVNVILCFHACQMMICAFYRKRNVILARSKITPNIKTVSCAYEICDKHQTMIKCFQLVKHLFLLFHVLEYSDHFGINFFVFIFAIIIYSGIFGAWCTLLDFSR